MAEIGTARSPRPIRFGVVAPVRTELPAWCDQIRRIADFGYSTLLMPDVQPWQPAPGPTLAVAATIAPQLRVGTWVYASPLRAPRNLAWEAHSLSILTEGRFEFGIGGGRPGLTEELHELGLPVSTSGPLGQLREAVRLLRELDGPDRHTPVAMAVHGPEARALAVELADTVTFAAPPGETRAGLARMAAEFRAAGDAELALHIPVVGDSVSAFMAPPDTDPAELREVNSLLTLPEDPAAVIDQVLHRREEHGFSYFVIGADAVRTIAPVVAAVAGR